MDTEFLVEMREFNKCGKVVNDEIFNLHLGSGASPWLSIPYLLQHTSQTYWFHPPTKVTSKNQKTKKLDSTRKILYPVALVYVHRTQV